MCSTLPARTDIDPEHRFDLTSIFESPDEWEAAYEELQDRLNDLESLAAEEVESAADLGHLVNAVADCFQRKQRLELYATLAANVATDDDEATDRKSRSERLAESFEPAARAALRRIGNCSEDESSGLPEEERRYARNLRKQAVHVKSSEVEEAIAAFEQPLGASARVARAARLDDFDPPTVERPDGESVEIRYGNRQAALSHPDRDYRKRVYDAYRERMNQYEHTLTQAFAEKLHAARARASVRDYDSTREWAFSGRSYPESGLGVSFPGEAHDVMLETVRESLDPYHDALELRRRRLGAEPLRPWDLHVSMAEEEPPELDYETAKAHILAALKPLGEEYVERARAFFAQRRIDVYPTQNKRTDIPAYCPSSAADGAYILANFEGDVRTAFYLCHELGHALAVEHQREGPARYATAPRPVEEVPSILHELLLVDHLLEEGDALADAARNRLLDCVGGNLYGAARSSVVTHELAGRVEDGKAVTVDRKREVVTGVRDEFYAPVEYPEETSRELPVSGIRDPYCYYQYVLGATGALAVKRRLDDGSLSTAEYREFLRSTGRSDAVRQFEQFGCDLQTPEPFETAARTFEAYVSEFERTWSSQGNVEQ